MRLENKMAFKNITVEMPVIGFTGALGSGCTYLAQGLAKHYDFAYCSLSEPIRVIARQSKVDDRTESLQDLGNELRRQCGRDILVKFSLAHLDKSISTSASERLPKGIIVDSIRNTGEVEALREFPNFFLLSIQAETETRQKRTIGTGPGKKFRDIDEFLAADVRDRDEQTDCGQQVMGCNYVSDIIILNEPEEEIRPDASGPYKNYIQKSLFEPYISLILHVCEARLPNERWARPEQALMTAAYVESRRSSCLKRKVGAVIASPKGEVISAGHNDVPETGKPCIEDARYGWCARDRIQEKLGQQMKHCPNCGAEIKIEKYPCRACGEELADFRKRCPNEKCRRSVECPYKCPDCDTDVFRKFLPGTGSGDTGRLLDMCRALHAEENAILNLCKSGTALPHLHSKGSGLPEGCVLYSTTFPCNLCANKIVTVGIKKVVYAEPYTTEEAKKIFSNEGVKLERFQGVKSRAYFRLYG